MVIVLLVVIPAVALAEPVAVTTQSVDSLGFYPSRSAPGTVISLNDSNISAETTGVLIDLLPQAGETVEQNALLASIDCTDHTLALREMRARLESARAEQELARFRLAGAAKLAKTNSVSAELLNEREARQVQASAEVARLESAAMSAERNIARCEIRAPYRAVVIERLASLGELVSPGTPLLRILDIDNLEISAQIQEQDVSQLQQARVIRFAADQNEHRLTLRTVLPLVDSRLRSYEVRLRFSETRGSPGEAGRIVWELPRLHVPPDVIVGNGDQLGVFRAIDHRAVFIPLPNAREGMPSAVELPGNAELIVDGRFAVTTGTPIIVRSD